MGFKVGLVSIFEFEESKGESSGKSVPEYDGAEEE